MTISITKLAARYTCILLSLLPIAVASWSLNSSNSKSFNRREAFSLFVKAAAGGALVLPIMLPQDARAACMPGDLSKECIGVYKIPLQDAINSPTLNTREALKRSAPDLTYVKPTEPPKSVRKAKEELQAQRAAADDIKVAILAGRLEEAGIKVLGLVPKITGAGMAIQEEVQINFPVGLDSGSNEMRVMKFQQQLQDLLALWSQIDVEIGQGLRGQLGASAVAQLSILESLKDAIAAFDDFLLVVDANTPS